MKQFLLRALKALFLVLFPGLLAAQNSSDYTVKLNAGNYEPRANAASLQADADVFRKSLFNGRHYVTLQFYALPDQAAKNKLKTAGVELIDYIPNLTYTAAVKQGTDLKTFKNAGVRSVFQLTSAQKTVPAFLRKEYPAHAVKQRGFVDITIITYEKLPAKTVGVALKKVKATILEDMPMYRSFTVRVPQANLINLIGLPFIQWVEPIDAPNVAENLLGRTLHRVNVLNEGVRNLKGDSVNIGIWDGGEVSPHLDFSPSSRMTLMETSQPESHATHVAGTIGGRGIINPKAQGMAPNSKLYSYNFSGNILTEMFNAIPALNLAVSSHSYGSTQTCGITGAGVAYSSSSRSTDINLNTYPYHLHVHSAGNSQTACSGGWSTITGSGKTAKNNILVANITTSDAMSGSSSFGPVADGRVKPEISSLGTNVLSTYTPLNSYGTISGTSMATPGVSGTVALLVQRYKQLNNNIAPVSSLIKAAICNTAHDLGNPGPDYKFGYGRLNALSAVRALEENRYVVNTITTGATIDVPVSIPAGTARLKVMLTWNDPAGTSNANPALVNNLDLSVVNGTNITLPWKLNGTSPASNATRGVDNVSNIEQVTIDNPTAGSYTLRVAGTAIPTGPNQQYSLTWEIDQPYLEIIYPNGNESLSPGAAESITWNSAGVTGNQTVQYSLDNGATWVTLSAAVPASITRMSWTVPTGANTATALVRVTSSTVSDVSDANFKILGTPAGLSSASGPCAGSLNFTWPAVTNATNYDLYKLDAATGNWVILAANVAGTSYAASGLTPGASMWFTVIAKNNLTGATGERALAINRMVPSSGSVTLGPISGQTNLCPNTQNLSYSVPAAAGVTNYTWTVPTGATIVSGQGTNTITVNYGAANTTGLVSVSGTAGACQTAAQNLTVTVNNQLTPPVSGGDKTICATPTSNSLVASASAPAGYNLIWYSAASGGTPVANPQLLAPGTITYFAASVNPIGNCESATRTPVTLTINQAPQPTIASNGSTTVCEGNTVTLTASPGSAYQWSNGATSQSVTVLQSGNYSVTVSQANGCSAASAAATQVTIVPKAVLNLAAEPLTSLTPGQTTTLKVTGTYDASTALVWKKNGEVIQGASKAELTLSVPVSGEYTVEASNSLGCVAASNKVALTDAAADGIFLYPNPNSGKFQVRYYTQPGVTTTNSITIYDSRGAKIALQPNSVKQAYQRMDVDMGQRKGFFWVVLHDAEGNYVASGRVVIQ